jgi:hypothetical protein
MPCHPHLFNYLESLHSNMPITTISSNFNIFLELLLADIEAFVTGEQDHKYLDTD